jgi:hypothetical protein
MARLRRYFHCSKIEEAKLRQVARCFALDVTATQTAKITDLSLQSGIAL